MHSNLGLVLILLSAAVAAVGLARYFGLSSILAYLLIGIAVGPHGARLLAETSEVASLAEFGIVFLMFSIGLEFSLSRLKAMRVLVLGFGGAQVILTAIGTALVTWFGYQQGWQAGLAVGLAVAMSSTAIVARLLSERFELHSRSGRQTMGALLFQDLAVVPCLILFPALAQPAGDLVRSLSIAMTQAVVVLAVLIGLGRWPIREMFGFVARRRSEELFVLTTLWIVVLLGFATLSAGLSLALGAFVGGILISETIYRHQVESDIRPFRDVLLGLFFVTVGMMLDPAFVLANWHRLLLAVVLLVVGKGLVVLAVALFVRTPLPVALRTAAQLAQGGEFGLVLIELAHELKLIGDDVFQVTLSAMLISMFLAAFLIERAARFAGELGTGDWAHQAKVIHDIAVGAFALERHVILCGYGRTGRQIGEFLAVDDISFIALDIDPQRVRHTVPEGGKVLFGNGDRPEVLKAAGLARARAIVVTYPEAHVAEATVRLIRSLRPDIPIIARTPDETGVDRLKAAGATEVIPEALEGSLLVAVETMAQIGVPIDQTMARVRALRAARYPSLRGFYRDFAQGDDER